MRIAYLVYRNVSLMMTPDDGVKTDENGMEMLVDQ